MQRLFLFLAIFNLLLMCVCGIAAGEGVIPVVHGFVLCLVCLCLAFACLAQAEHTR